MFIKHEFMAKCVHLCAQNYTLWPKIVFVSASSGCSLLIRLWAQQSVCNYLSCQTVARVLVSQPRGDHVWLKDLTVIDNVNHTWAVFVFLKLEWFPGERTEKSSDTEVSSFNSNGQAKWGQSISWHCSSQTGRGQRCSTGGWFSSNMQTYLCKWVGG